MKYLSRIEWEFLQEEKEIIFIEETNLNLFEVTKIYLKRNEKYEILLDIIGKVNQHDSEEIKKLNQPVDIHIKTKFQTYDLLSCHIIKNTMTYPQNEYMLFLKFRMLKEALINFLIMKNILLKNGILIAHKTALFLKEVLVSI